MQHTVGSVMSNGTHVACARRRRRWLSSRLARDKSERAAGTELRSIREKRTDRARTRAGRPQAHSRAQDQSSHGDGRTGRSSAAHARTATCTSLRAGSHPCPFTSSQDGRAEQRSTRHIPPWRHGTIPACARRLHTPCRGVADTHGQSPLLI